MRKFLRRLLGLEDSRWILSGGNGGNAKDSGRPGHGGNVCLDIEAGNGGIVGSSTSSVPLPLFDGSIRFLVGGKEKMRIDPDGGFYVDGEKVSKKKDAYVTFVEWLREREVYVERGGDAGKWQ